MRRLIREVAERHPEAKKLTASEIADKSVIELLYVIYQQLSLEALHCSITALGRHLTREQGEAANWELVLSVGPRIGEGTLFKTPIQICDAVICVTVTTNELVGFTSQSERLAELANEFTANGWHRVA